jgi:hypothetical protein
LLLLMLISTTLALVAACIPSRVKELNTLGSKAVAARQYDKAISYFSESLAIHPDQPKIRLKLDSSKTMLKQVYVFKIYDLVDGPFQPVGTFLNVWRMSADLPKLNVAPARVASIRIDLDKHFMKLEPQLRAKTEHHSYYLHLSQMQRLVRSQPVDQTRGEVAGLLQGQHIEAQKRADSARLQGLALLHTAAAATFAPGDTGLWAEVTRRRKALLNRLGIRISLAAQGAPGGSSSHYLLGGIKRRLPRIFIVGPSAPLSLSLQARRPQSDQREVGDRRSAKCQVGTRREPNPECDPLKRRAEMARRTYEQKLGALQTAQSRCSSTQQASSCTSYLSSANRDVSSAKRHYEDLEQQVGRCPPYVDKPVFKVFFYERRTVSRRASVSGTVTVMRGGQVWRSRAVVGSAEASDTYGPGLGCARIPADPLSLASLSTLRAQAEEQMLSNSLRELYQLRRELANRQLAGGNNRDQRLDALVRARLVDESYKRVAQLLQQNLAGMWASDFGLTTRIVR